MLYTTEIYLVALLYNILESFLQREMTSAHGDCFFPISDRSSKMLNIGTYGMDSWCEHNQADDQTIRNDGERPVTKKGSYASYLTIKRVFNYDRTPKSIN